MLSEIQKTKIILFWKNIFGCVNGCAFDLFQMEMVLIGSSKSQLI